MTRSTSFALAVLSSSLIATLGCSSSSGTTTTTQGAGGSTSSSATTTSTMMSTTSTGGGGGSGPMCNGPGYGGGEKTIPGGQVAALITDQTGAPAANQPIFICGIDLCSQPAKTDASGKASIMTSLMEKKPAFKFGDALTYAEFGIPIEVSPIDFGPIATAKFPAAGATLSPGADAVSGGVTVTIAAGASVMVNDLIFGTPDQQKFRAQDIPVASAKPILAPTMMQFDMLYGIAPAGTLICPAAKVTVPNTPAWPAGTKVEFWVTTIDTGQEYAPYSGWAKTSDGAVSADGMSVVTADGQGFAYLDNFAVRKAP